MQDMNIFIYLPNWLGDAVMASAALKALLTSFPKAKYLIYGSFVSSQIYENLSRDYDISFVIENKKKRFRQALSLRAQHFDLAISFKGSMSARLFLLLLRAKKRLMFFQKISSKHQVLKYLELLRGLVKIPENPELFLPFKKRKTQKLFGINAGAKYGSAKRYEPEYFAIVAKHFAPWYKIVIFGVESEQELCAQIEQSLLKKGVKAINLCGKTSIKNLVKIISSLDLMLSNDSGPMHVAAAMGVKTLGIFGPTNFYETSPFSKRASIVHLSLACMPCMKRICPLKHQNCMKQLMPELIIKKLELLQGL